jgi:hypothetical protein
LLSELSVLTALTSINEANSGADKVIRLLSFWLMKWKDFTF